MSLFTKSSLALSLSHRSLPQLLLACSLAGSKMSSFLCVLKVAPCYLKRRFLLRPWIYKPQPMVTRRVCSWHDPKTAHPSICPRFFFLGELVDLGMWGGGPDTDKHSRKQMMFLSACAAFPQGSAIIYPSSGKSLLLVLGCSGGRLPAVSLGVRDHDTHGPECLLVCSVPSCGFLQDAQGALRPLNPSAPFCLPLHCSLLSLLRENSHWARGT